MKVHIHTKHFQLTPSTKPISIPNLILILTLILVSIHTAKSTIFAQINVVSHAEFSMIIFIMAVLLIGTVFIEIRYFGQIAFIIICVRVRLHCY